MSFKFWQILLVQPRMRVQLIKNPDGLNEHMLIELQGTIENHGQPLAGQILGTLVWIEDNNEAILQIGNHLLDGKIFELEKPFLLVKPSSPSQHVEKRTMFVEAIIRRKFVFKDRPKLLP